MTTIEREITELDEAENATPEETFRITDEGRANWLLRKLANIDAERQRVLTQSKEILRGLDADETRLRFLFEAELADFARQQIDAQGGRKKSLKLLQGTLAFRTVPTAVKLTDGAAALAYALRQGLGDDYTRRELATSAYRELAEQVLIDTGELLPGVEAIAEHESFSIRFNPGKGNE